MYEILYDAAAEDDLLLLRPYDAGRILDEVEDHLVKNPMAPDRRKKLLKGLLPPWDAVRPVWQLVGDFRVFYDVDQERREVIVRAVRRKGSRRTEEIL